jgi:hypothetical protein
MAMSITIYCNDCEQFVSLDPQGNCKFCGSHSVGVVDLFSLRKYGKTPSRSSSRWTNPNVRG